MMLSSLMNSLTSAWSGPLDASIILVKLLTTTLIASAVLTQLETRRNARLLSVDADEHDSVHSDAFSPETLQIRWMWENDHEHFLATLMEGAHAVAQSADRLRMTVSLRPSLFLALSEDAATQVLEALGEAPIAELIFNDSLVQPEEYERWIRFCRSLGAQTTLQHVKFYLQYGDFRALAGAIRSMPFIANLSLFDNDDEGDTDRFNRTCQAEHVAAFAAALQNHPCLQFLDCRLGKAAYDEMLPDVLPILPTIPLLQQVILSENATSEPASATAATALSPAATVLSHSASSPPEIRITNLEFLSKECSTRFCQGMARAKTSRIHLDNVLVDAEALAQALGSSSVAHLKLTNWPKKPASLPLFLATLAKKISDMPLETLDLENVIMSAFDRGYDVDTLLAYEQAMSELVRAASRNTVLRSLKLPAVRYSEDMDAALAGCVGARESQLEEITLSCPCMPPDAKVEYSSLLDALHTNAVIQNVQAEPAGLTFTSCLKAKPVKFPRLLKALRSNVSLHHVHFKPCRLGCVCMEPFCETSKRVVATVTKLNQAGRSYMSTQPCNRSQALRVLEQVQNDTDCLYYHLRENPLLMRS